MSKRTAWNSSLPAPTKPMPRSPMKKKGRGPAEYARIYGSVKRSRVMRRRPCDMCGREANEDVLNQNVHVPPVGVAGMGYKAGWEWVITGCDTCHRVLHWMGSVEEFDRVKDTDLRAIARRLAVEIPA